MNLEREIIVGQVTLKIRGGVNCALLKNDVQLKIFYKLNCLKQFKKKVKSRINKSINL